MAGAAAAPRWPPTRPRPPLRAGAGTLDKGEAQKAVAHAGYRLDPPAFEALFRRWACSVCFPAGRMRGRGDPWGWAGRCTGGAWECV